MTSLFSVLKQIRSYCSRSSLMLRFKQFSTSEVEWSDEDDSEDKYLVKQPDHDSNLDEESLDSFQINEKPDNLDSSLVGVDRLADHKRSNFSGYVQVDKVKRSREAFSRFVQQEKVSDSGDQFPSVPTNAVVTLGRKLLSDIWRAFVLFGADDSEMILVRDARRLDEEVGDADLGTRNLALLKNMDSSDYVEFRTLVVEIARHYRPHQRHHTSAPSDDICKVCCALVACQHCVPSSPRRDSSRPATAISGNEDGKENVPLFQFVGSEEYRLGIVYSEIKNQLGGKVRVKHIGQLMEHLLIPFDKKRLPRSFWVNRGELLICSEGELSELVAQLRTDQEKVVDPLAAMFRYELPQWLREEFKASEIMLYEHHFALIDKDGGGSIDVDELQALVTAFGSKISREDAQNMLDEYDMDGGGTIDFVEFMVLIYKIQRGTIDLSSSDLAQALVEAKSQLKVFEEIEEVSRNPPAYCAVDHFGGSPVECNFTISGPPGSPYEGQQICLQMTFHDGYPYRQPDVVFKGRVMGLHILPGLGGDARLIHVKQLWSAEWSMHRLLEHVVDILARPDPQLLPDHLYVIYAAWEKALPGKRDALKELAAAQLRKELLAESKSTEDGEVNGEGEKKVDPPKAEPASGAGSGRGNSAQNVAESKVVSGDRDVGGKDSSRKGSPHPPGSGRQIDSAAAQLDEDALRERALQLERALTMDDLSDDATRRKVIALPRIERMHLATMLVHLLDPLKYHRTVEEFMRLHYKA